MMPETKTVYEVEWFGAVMDGGSVGGRASSAGSRVGGSIYNDQGTFDCEHKRLFKLFFVR